MARERALLLGADASRAMTGEKIEIGDCAEWEVRFQCTPNSDQIFLTHELEIEITHRDGTVFLFPLRQPIKVSGKTIRASILKPIHGVKQVSIFVKEVA